MRHLVKRLAKKVEVSPAYLKGGEERGLFFCGELHSEYIGGQCAHCNTIIWVANRSDPILSAPPPADMQDAGPEWTQYFYARHNRFLKSLPSCPECGRRHYDRFIWGGTWARFADGSEFDVNTMVERLVELDPSTVDVWVLEEDTLEEDTGHVHS